MDRVHIWRRLQVGVCGCVCGWGVFVGVYVYVYVCETGFRLKMFKKAKNHENLHFSTFQSNFVRFLSKFLKMALLRPFGGPCVPIREKKKL